MLRLIIVFFLLLIGIGLGWKIHQDSDYLLIKYGQWQIETNLWIMLIALVLMCLLSYFLIRIFIRVSGFKQTWQKWRFSSNERQAHQLAEIGACQLAENQWQSAENNFKKAIDLSKKPLIYYMAAAFAAHQQKSYENRDSYLKNAYLLHKDAEISLGFYQAQLQINAGQQQLASVTLSKLQNSVPHHPLLIQLNKLNN